MLINYVSLYFTKSYKTIYDINEMLYSLALVYFSLSNNDMYISRSVKK